jgi:DeoR/GlpR family transcriptional regulator of sugar metabolism
MKITAKERHARIRELIVKDKPFNVSDLAASFGVSEMTIHRDLNKLEQEGHIRRVHGGAVPAEKMVFEFDFSSRRKAGKKAKQAIAAQAVKLIKPGQIVILDTGTTTLELALLIKELEDLTVITPSIAVASVLQFSTSIQTILLGGSIRKGSPDLTGVITERVLDMFMADIAFQGADGIGLNGEMYNSDMRIASVDQKMRRRAHHTYILCDSSKIGRTDLAFNGSLAETDGLITDSNIDKQHLSYLKEINPNIKIVNL